MNLPTNVTNTIAFDAFSPPTFFSHFNIIRFIYSFSSYVLSIYKVPGIVLDPWATLMDKTDTSTSPLGFIFQGRIFV